MALSFPTSDVVSNKRLAESGAVNSGKALFYGCVLTAGDDAASVTFYDNTEGSGTKILTAKAASGTTASCLTWPVRCATAVYAVVTGTSPELNTFYTDLS